MPEKDPVQVFKALGGLEVIRKEKVVGEGNHDPDKIGTEEERLAGQLVNPVARCCNLTLLVPNCKVSVRQPLTWEVVPGALVWSTQEGASKNDPLGPVPARPAGKRPTLFLRWVFSDITVNSKNIFPTVACSMNPRCFIVDI